MQCIINLSIHSGPGVWELRAKGQARDTRKHRTTTVSKAIPTTTHMSFVQLVEEGLLKAVISQNCDGLHRRSGLPKNSEYSISVLRMLQAFSIIVPKFNSLSL